MADKKISALTGASTPLAGTEVLPIVQSGSTVKVATNDLTVRNIRANATTGILQVTGPTAATTRVVTVPDANFTAARTDAAQTFTGTQTINGVVDVISGTGDQLLLNIKTNDSTAANNAGVGLRVNSSATAANRFSQLWFDADGANLSGGDYFIISKNGNDGLADIINYSPAVMRFATNYIGRAAIDLTIETTGNVTVNNGNLVIGTSGKGIDFSATTEGSGTMTSELFDDYEEGDWTPTFTRDTPPTFTYGTVVGKYTKIGDTVAVQGTMFFTVTSAGGGLCYIGGLPFAANSTSGYSATGSVSYADCLSGGAVSVYVGAGGTGKVITVNGACPSTGFATGRLYFSITYKV
jgi:hypothetical protein